MSKNRKLLNKLNDYIFWHFIQLSKNSIWSYTYNVLLSKKKKKLIYIPCSCSFFKKRRKSAHVTLGVRVCMSPGNTWKDTYPIAAVSFFEGRDRVSIYCYHFARKIH